MATCETATGSLTDVVGLFTRRKDMGEYSLNGVNELLLSMEYDKLIIVLIAGFFTLAGSIIAAVITYNRAKSLERLKQNTNLKVQAYVDYIRGITGAAGIKDIDKQKMAEFNSLILDAKIRIAMYGSPNTVKCLSDFCANGSGTQSETGMNSLLAVIQSMRSDFDKTTVNEDDIYRLLYNEYRQNNKQY